MLRRSRQVRTRRTTAALALALVGLAVAAALPVMSQGAAFAARASVDPIVQYLEGTAGTLLTFTVHNTGTSAPIGAVEIATPSASFSVLACPQRRWAGARRCDQQVPLPKR